MASFSRASLGQKVGQPPLMRQPPLLHPLPLLASRCSNFPFCFEASS